MSTKKTPESSEKLNFEAISEKLEELTSQLENSDMILEFYTPGEPNSGWIHCSYTADKPRKQFLWAYKSEGKTKYKPVIGKAVDLV